MMTKTQFANMIIKQETKDGVTNVGQSSRYGISMDFLGLLSKEDSEYAQCRGGCEYFYHDKTTNELVHISTIEMFSLLPD